MSRICFRRLSPMLPVFGMFGLSVLFAACGQRGVAPGQPMEPPTVGPMDAATVNKHQQASAERLGVSVDITNSIGMKLALIPAGEFLMGSPGERRGDPFTDRERPRHKVRITRPFYLGVYEVTQAEYEKVQGKNPSEFKGATHPVEMVSWDDAVEFCRVLSAEEGKTYRLPTEAEWEYACRAGTTTRYGFGDEVEDLGEYAWYANNSDEKTHPVGEKKANAFGLHDMHGNVWELCQDRYDSDYYKNSPVDDPEGPNFDTMGREKPGRLLRGGGLENSAEMCRAAFRNASDRVHRPCDGGFRVVLDLPRP